MIKRSAEKNSTLLQRLNALSIPYKEKREIFGSRCALLKSQFGLKPGQERKVDFGIITTADRSLQEYVDILNTDPELNDLRSQIDTIILEGCVEILKELKTREINIPGYDIDSFIKSPDENIQEIKDLMQGLGGYKHIHSIGEKIAL